LATASHNVTLPFARNVGGPTDGHHLVPGAMTDESAGTLSLLLS